MARSEQMGGFGQRVVLKRPCMATAIPSGEAVELPSGSEVLLMQALGGHFTVQTLSQGLVRIDRGNAGALGMEEISPAENAPAGGEFEMDRVWEELRQVYDPEIPVNIVELGLIYRCQSNPLPTGEQRVEIVMTVTAPGCGMGSVLAEDVRQRVLAVPGVAEAEVELVFEPPWTPERMTDAARLQLGWM